MHLPLKMTKNKNQIRSIYLKILTNCAIFFTVAIVLPEKTWKEFNLRKRINGQKGNDKQEESESLTQYH